MSIHTKQEYKDVASYVMGIGDFSADAIETKLESLPEPPEATPIPDPEKADIVSLFNALYVDYPPITKAIEKLGGVDLIAQSHNMTASQCKQCIKDFEAILALYNTPVEEE